MIWMIFWSIAAHHSESADPDLLQWIKSRLDHLLHLDPWAVVVLVGLFMLLIPVSVVTLYLVQRRRLGFDPRRSPGDQS